MYFRLWHTQCVAWRITLADLHWLWVEMHNTDLLVGCATCTTLLHWVLFSHLNIFYHPWRCTASWIHKKSKPIWIIPTVSFIPIFNQKINAKNGFQLQVFKMISSQRSCLIFKKYFFVFLGLAKNFYIMNQVIMHFLSFKKHHIIQNAHIRECSEMHHT
jgi:hypothetical protein